LDERTSEQEDDAKLGEERATDKLATEKEERKKLKFKKYFAHYANGFMAASGNFFVLATLTRQHHPRPTTTLNHNFSPH
jgi:hypothetical protein